MVNSYLGLNTGGPYAVSRHGVQVLALSRAKGPGETPTPWPLPNHPDAFLIHGVDTLVQEMQVRAEAADDMCGCIAVLEVYAHGNPLELTWGNDIVGESTATAIGERLRSEGYLCEYCLIIANSCNAGNWGSEKSPAAKLASATSCRVAAAGGFGIDSGYFLTNNAGTTATMNGQTFYEGVDATAGLSPADKQWYYDNTDDSMDHRWYYW
jgi:hypothetical protein